MAQKWRAFKNIARLYKNPYAYVFWKFHVLSSQNRIRLVWLVLFYHLYSSFSLYLLTKLQKENMLTKFLYSTGDVNQFYGLPNELRMPADRKKNYLRYSNFHQARRNKKTDMIHLNWWCRDQNFRKYFEMRKKQGIQPSMSGFYHEPIHAETVKQHQEWADLRASRQAR